MWRVGIERKSKSSASSEKKNNTITVSPFREKTSISPASSKIVTAPSVQAENVPTIPLGSLQTISAIEPEIAVRSVATTRSVQLPTPLVSQPTEYRRSL